MRGDAASKRKLENVPSGSILQDDGKEARDHAEGNETERVGR
jgi:hypothetical protein